MPDFFLCFEASDDFWLFALHFDLWIRMLSSGSFPSEVHQECLSEGFGWDFIFNTWQVNDAGKSVSIHPHAGSVTLCRKMVWMWNRVAQGQEVTFTARTQSRLCLSPPSWPVLGGPGFRSVGWFKEGIRLPFGKGTVLSLQLS